MKSNILALSVSLLILFNLSACSRIKSFFPDKSKEYQLITEIPPLTVPSDLSSDAIRNSEVIDPSVPVFQIKEGFMPPDSEDIDSSTEDNVADENVTEEKTVEKENIYVDLLEFSGGATRIRIEDTMDRNWRRVGKALSRHSIEITARDELDRVFYVQYDADFKKVEDGSLWDEALFIFGSDPAQEKEFRVRLVENGSLTEVIVLDKNDKPLSKGPGLKLLKLIFESIKEELADAK
jgi:outer membrane protein assembly factor BamC